MSINGLIWSAKKIPRTVGQYFVLLSYVISENAEYYICICARLFSALFGHAVADEYANVRRDRDADCILCTHRSKLTVTDYKPHAACRTGCERRSYTHTPNTSDINQPPSNTVGLYVNQ